MASITTSTQQKQIPKDALVIASILKELGITEYEPRVINQLLEFTHRYVTSVLEDSKVYANHAKKKAIDMEDVQLAVQMQLDRSFTNPPPRDILLEIARMKNNSPLPLVKPHYGIRLPPDRYCLNSCNYRMRSTAPKKQQFGHTSQFRVQPQGANKVGVKGPQLQPVKRQPSASLTISTPKPVIKFSPAGMQQIQNIQSPKPKIQIATPGIQRSDMTVNLQSDDENSLKRKREPDDFDAMDTQ